MPADRREWQQQRRGETICEWIMYDTWQMLIGMLDLSHLNYLNSIISLQINFLFLFFYQNS